MSTTTSTTRTTTRLRLRERTTEFSLGDSNKMIVTTFGHSRRQHKRKVSLFACYSRLTRKLLNADAAHGIANRATGCVHFKKQTIIEGTDPKTLRVRVQY